MLSSHSPHLERRVTGSQDLRMHGGAGGGVGGPLPGEPKDPWEVNTATHRKYRERKACYGRTRDSYGFLTVKIILKQISNHLSKTQTATVILVHFFTLIENL